MLPPPSGGGYRPLPHRPPSSSPSHQPLLLRATHGGGKLHGGVLLLLRAAEQRCLLQLLLHRNRTASAAVPPGDRPYRRPASPALRIAANSTIPSPRTAAPTPVPPRGQPHLHRQLLQLPVLLPLTGRPPQLQGAGSGGAPSRRGVGGAHEEGAVVLEQLLLGLAAGAPGAVANHLCTQKLGAGGHVELLSG